MTVFDKAPCKGQTELFFPPTDEYRNVRRGEAPAPMTQARTICATCPHHIKQHCAAEAIEHGERLSFRADVRTWVDAERATLPRIAGPTLAEAARSRRAHLLGLTASMS